MTRAEARRICQKRYSATVKGKATRARYRASAKGKAKEAAANVEKNTRRTWIGRRYIGMAETPELADVVNSHTRGRLLGFKQEQRGAA